MAAYSGSQPSTTQVTTRLQTAIQILDYGTTVRLDETAKQQVVTWKARLQEAAKVCALEMEEVKAARCSLKGRPVRNIDACKEVGGECLMVICETA